MPYANRICANDRCREIFRPRSLNDDRCGPCRMEQAADRKRGVPPEKRGEDDTPVRSALNRALRDLDRMKNTKEDLVRAVYRAAADAIEGLEFEPVKAPKKDPRRGSAGEVAILPCADWQLAKTTPTYSTDVCERRVRAYAETVLKLTEIQRRDHPVRDARIYLLGDLIEGELIFPGQPWRQDASLYRQVMVDGPRILGNLIRTMLSEFDNVHVVGVIGNHGALGGHARGAYHHPETNGDAMMYEVTRQALGETARLTWDPNSVKGERKWFALDAVGRKRFFLFHGDQIQGGRFGFPWYGFGKAIAGWRMNVAEFEYSLSGHFHNPVRFNVGPITHWGSGSTESDNTYAAEELKVQGSPSQWLLFAHPERGVTAEYEVHLS